MAGVVAELRTGDTMTDLAALIERVKLVLAEAPLRLDGLRAGTRDDIAALVEAEAERDALARRVGELEKALRFYASDASWTSEMIREGNPDSDDVGDWAPPQALEDQGDIARIALA